MTALGPILPDNATVLDEEVDSELQLDLELPDAYGFSPLFNFGPDGDVGFEQRGAQGALTVVDDQRSLMTWIEKAIRTPRGQYMIYDEDYGTDIAAEVGSLGYQALLQNGEADLKRCLLIHPLIQDIQDVSITQTTESDTVLIQMTVIDVISGPLELEVAV